MSFRSARVGAGLTQAAAAARLHVTDSAISQWETGDTMPDSRRLREIAEVYGVTVDELLEEGDGNV